MSYDYTHLVDAESEQRDALQKHSLYGRLVGLEELRWFTGSHVYVNGRQWVAPDTRP